MLNRTTPPRSTDTGARRDHPLLQLGPEDLNLVTELVLQSGSLKGLAKSYGVSYPTIRARLDKVIERLRRAVEGREPDPLTDLLADLVDRGDMTPGAARAVRDLARSMAQPEKRNDPGEQP
ncbi:MAG: DUF2089 family protein [Phycisphaeraceae bacterium]|nr:MAG: DUF2089 family protein [Phycisphaeraceae bacterium]